jgi:hypothetical protein
MPESHSDRGPTAARIAVGGLAGALIGAVVAAVPVQAADPAEVASATVAAQSSIADQFRGAFAPGAADTPSVPSTIVVGKPE